MDNKDRLIRKLEEVYKLTSDTLDNERSNEMYDYESFANRANKIDSEISQLKAEIKNEDEDKSKIVDAIYGNINERLAFIIGLLQGMNNYLHDKLK